MPPLKSRHIDDDRDDGRLSTAELKAAIGSMTAGQKAAIVLASRGFSARCGIPANDLMNEAFCLIYEGRRRCKRGVDIVAFVAGVMRGLAWDENVSRRNGHIERTIENIDDMASPLWHVEQPSPEHAAISRLADGAALAEIDKLVLGDEQLELLLEGIKDGLEGVKLEELLGVDKKGLATARKRLMRALVAKFPEKKTP